MSGDNDQPKKWWQQEMLRIFKASTTNDPVTDFYQDFDERAELVASTGCNVTELMVGMQRLGTPVYFKTSAPVKFVDDKLAEQLEAYHKRNLRVTVYVNVHAVEREFGDEHPEFVQHTRDGSPRVIYGRDYPVCCNSPHARKWFMQIHEDLLKYDIDGIFNDGLPFYLDCCYCEFCRARFKEQYGKELPPREDLLHPDLPDMTRFQMASITEWQKLHEQHIHSINPNVLYSRNIGAPLGAHIRMGKSYREFGKIMDLVYPEVALSLPKSQPVLRGSLGCRLVEIIAPGKCVGISGFMHKPYEYAYLPPEQIRLNAVQIAANGAHSWTATRIVSKPQLEAYSEMNRFLRKHDEHYLNTRSIARVALLWPERTINFSPQTALIKEDMEDGVKAAVSKYHGNPAECFYGGSETLFRNHIPFDVVDEVELCQADLVDRYEVVILANAINLSDEHIRCIRQYVGQGGTLVASHQTGLCDEFGRERESWPLTDLFGIMSTGEEIGPRRLEHVGPAGQATIHPVTEHLHQKHLLTGPNRDMWMSCPEWFLSCALKEGEALLYHSQKARGSSGSGRPPVLDPEPFPAMVHNRVGKGQVFYFNGLFFLHYWQQTHNDFRLLLGRLFEHCGCRVVTLENAHETVEVVLREKSDGTRLLHLINCTGQMAKPITKVIPCFDLKVHVSLPGFAVDSIHALWSDQALDFQSDGNAGVSFGLKKLDLYEVIVLKGTRA